MNLSQAMIKADKTLDIQGLVHPRSRVVIEMTMARLDPGQTLTVITDDMSAKEIVPALCSHLDYTLLESGREGRALSFTIRKGTSRFSPIHADGTGE